MRKLTRALYLWYELKRIIITKCIGLLASIRGVQPRMPKRILQVLTTLIKRIEFDCHRFILTRLNPYDRERSLPEQL